MTPAQAAQVGVGDRVIHPSTVPPYAPIRVRAVMLSHAGRPMARLEGCGSAWLPLVEYGLPERGWAFARHSGCWEEANGQEVPAAKLRALCPPLVEDGAA